MIKSASGFKPTVLVAALWGLAIFLPVGTHYLAILLFIGLSLLGVNFSARLRRIRQSTLFWPSLVFTVWALMIYIIQPQTFQQTYSNLGHIFRIALTLLVVISFTKEEATAALKGMAASFALVLFWLSGYHAGLLPHTEFWAHLTDLTSNKVIAASILFSFAAAASYTLMLSRSGWSRIASLIAFVLCTFIIVVVLEKRTAMLGVLLGLLAVTLHMWRDKPLRFFTGLLSILAITGILYTALPDVQKSIGKGIRQVERALDGEVSTKSWNIRVQMIRHTADMMMEKPYIGWGIGSWDTQWKSRVPESIENINMPHNDFLWMGSQAGIPGALAWLALMLAAAWAAWRSTCIQARMAFAVAVITLFSSLVNNGTRDATLAFPMLFVLGVCLALTRYAQDDVSP